jgi:hypothetical protein
MKRILPVSLLLLACAGLSAVLCRSVAADNPLGGDDWKYDIVYPKKGGMYRGLVYQRGGGVQMWCITRNPGRPAVFYKVKFTEDEVARVEMLPDDEHVKLRQRFETLREEHRRMPDPWKAIETDETAIPGVDKIQLLETRWRGDGKIKALAFRSTHFDLESNASRRIVLVAADQLEQVYAAYARFLPPRAKGRPTTILLPQSRADYQALVRGQGRTLLNPAFFDPRSNQIVCAFDWKQMGEELQHIHNEHVRLREKLTKCEADLRKAYKGDIPAELKAALVEQGRRIQSAESRNQEMCARARQRLFQRLFHEAFHAFWLNFVYPPPPSLPPQKLGGEGGVPRWLNEGLAQIFETAVFEVGELRIGHADRERLDAVRQSLDKHTFLPVTDLLRSKAEQFLVAHNGDKQVSDRYYLASWALAFYLTFDRKLLGTPVLDSYVRQLGRGTDPLEAFCELTGQPLADFEHAFLHYLNRLHFDGHVGAGE